MNGQNGHGTGSFVCFIPFSILPSTFHAEKVRSITHIHIISGVIISTTLGVQVTLSFRKSSNLKTWLVMKLGIMLSLHTDQRTIERLNLQHL